MFINSTTLWRYEKLCAKLYNGVIYAMFIVINSDYI